MPNLVCSSLSIAALAASQNVADSNKKMETEEEDECVCLREEVQGRAKLGET